VIGGGRDHGKSNASLYALIGCGRPVLNVTRAVERELSVFNGSLGVFLSRSFTGASKMSNISGTPGASNGSAERAAEDRAAEWLKEVVTTLRGVASRIAPVIYTLAITTLSACSTDGHNPLRKSWARRELDRHG
jgi:hypothetical protein